MDREQLLAELKSGRVNFANEVFDFDFQASGFRDPISLEGRDLRNADFRKAILKKQIFSKANLQGANFEGCALEGVNFADADMSGANLRNTKCSQTNFQKTVLVAANFSGSALHGQMNNSDCTDANFEGVQIVQAWLEGAVLTRANFAGSKMSSGYWGGFSSASAEYANFKGAELTGFVFRNANLRQANFTDANLANCNFEGVNLQGANLSGANLSGANFRNADLRTANLSACKFDGIFLKGTLISEGALPEKIELVHALINGYVFSAPGADLSFANLSDMRVEGLNLQAANLSNARIAGSFMRNSNLASAQLSGAKIHRSDFAESQLNDADFSKSDIESCHFFNADLSNSLFAGASCRESDFVNANLRDARNMEDLHLKPSALKGADLTGSDLDAAKTSGLSNESGGGERDEGTGQDLALVRVLEAKIDGLRHGSESDYPYEIRFWPKTRGEFTTEAFLQSVGHIHQLEVEILFDPTSPSRKGHKRFIEMVDLYTNLLETIVDDLQDYELYELGYKGDPDPMYNNLIFLARTKDGTYFGLAPTYKVYQGCSIQEVVQFSEYHVKESLLSSQSTLVEKVRKAMTGSKTKIDGVEYISWLLADNRAEAMEELVLKTKSASVKFEFSRSFSEDTHSESDDEDEDDRWREAIRLIHTNLSEFRTYILRSSTHDIYTWGRSKHGNWIALQTQVVWT